MGGVFMKTKTTISYVILKYDKKTDSIYTKTSNNQKNLYKIPSFNYEPGENDDLSDMKEFLENQFLNFKTIVDDSHIFIPSVNVVMDQDTQIFNYLAVVFESDKNVFASMNYETWHQLRYDKALQVWDLPWDSGLTDPVNFDLDDVSTLDYVTNTNLQNDEFDFCNLMRFVAEETKIFPILGLLSGEQFTLKEIIHYQTLLGIDNTLMTSDAAFEMRYAKSVKPVSDNKLSHSYQIKSNFLQK